MYTKTPTTMSPTCIAWLHQAKQYQKLN